MFECVVQLDYSTIYVYNTICIHTIHQLDSQGHNSAEDLYSISNVYEGVQEN